MEEIVEDAQSGDCRRKSDVCHGKTGSGMECFPKRIFIEYGGIKILRLSQNVYILRQSLREDSM